MIYSKSRDFLFIKGRKVAGTSVEIALTSVCGPDDILTPITPIDEYERLQLYGRGAQNYSKSPESERAYLAELLASDRSELARVGKPGEQYGPHTSLRRFIRVFGDLPTTRIFCVERNPYAKVISLINMAGNKFRDYRRHGRPMIMEIDELKETISSRLARDETLLCLNIHLYRNKQGEIPARVLRFESLAADFEQLMADYGIAPTPPLPHAKKGIDSNSIKPRSIFSREQLDKINEMFKEEFETFGYEML